MKKSYYHSEMERFIRFLVPKESSLLEIKSGITIQNLAGHKPYDYIILSDTIGSLSDIQKSLQEFHTITHDQSRVIITHYNYLWEPALKAAEKLHIKKPQSLQNWVSMKDLENFLYLGGFEVVKKGHLLLLPFYIPLLSTFMNRYLAKLPLIQKLCLSYYIIARPIPYEPYPRASVSVIIPARNEEGNIEPLIKKMPSLGTHTEIIFVEGHSTDNTLKKIEEVKKKYPAFDIKITTHEGKGKGDAVRKGFDLAKSDILMILDADITVVPEDLPKFYQALIEGKGDFINGSRLIYPLEKNSMRFLNILGNKFFGLAFTWLLGQRMRDTLCGTKALWKKDYERIKTGRAFFGDFDPFGDFDLLFGAAKLNLKIVDLPIRYQERTYGTTNIKRFSHGLLLLKMCFFVMGKIKFI